MGYSPVPKLNNVEGATHRSNLGGSSWYVLNASDEKKEAVSFLNEAFATDANFYGDILAERGAVGTYLPAAKVDSYQISSAFFNNQKIYGDFAQWLGEIPEVNYGLYTYEIDSVLSTMVPAIAQGAPIDKLLEDAEQQLQFQLQLQ
ncbi:hypothetical protein N9R79_06315 [Vibrio sp.]|nr:hypothetical protein [Vibrio sp.]